MSAYSWTKAIGGGTFVLGAIGALSLSGAGWAPNPPQGGGATRERWESLQALALLALWLLQATFGG